MKSVVRIAHDACVKCFLIFGIVCGGAILTGCSTSGHDTSIQTSSVYGTQDEGFLEILKTDSTLIYINEDQERAFVGIQVSVLQGSLDRDSSLLAMSFGHMMIEDMYVQGQRIETLQAGQSGTVYVHSEYYPLLEKAYLTSPGSLLRITEKSALGL